MRTLSDVIRCVVILGLLFASAANASAQSFQGGVRDAVKDAQGVIPGVTVMLLNRTLATRFATVVAFGAVMPLFRAIAIADRCP